jgi:hypothetical protein
MLLSAKELIMDEQARPLDKTTIACGVLAVAMGIFILLSSIGIIPSREAAGSEHWIGVIAGMAFVFAGIAVIIQTCAKVTATPDGELPPGTPMWIRAMLFILMLAIVASLGAIGTWVAFGTGEREFGSSIPFLPRWLNEPLGRTVFGFIAVLTWLIFAVMAVVGTRRLRGRKE